MLSKELKKIAKNINNPPKTSAFMEPEIILDDWVSVDGPMGGESTPAEYIDLDEVAELQKEIDEKGEVSLEGTSLNDYFENRSAYEIEVSKGYGARLSAPGYMDATGWSVFDTEAEAREYLMETYDLDENLEEIEEDW